MYSAGPGGDELIEQRPELPGTPEVLRMPLDADAEVGAWSLDRLDHPIRRGGADDQVAAYACDSLMVAAVHAADAGLHSAVEGTLQA